MQDRVDGRHRQPQLSPNGPQAQAALLERHDLGGPLVQGVRATEPDPAIFGCGQPGAPEVDGS